MWYNEVRMGWSRPFTNVLENNMTEETKTVVRPDTSEYQTARSASGAKSMHNGDSVAQALQGATLEEVYGLASIAMEVEVAELKGKYEKLNDGMQRMNLGNRIRGIVNKMNKEKEGHGDLYVTDLASGVRTAVEKRTKEAEAEKAKAAKEREAKAAEAKKAKEAKAKAAAEAKAKKAA